MILVLCHGNKYRSVICECILREYGFDVVSAGFRPGGLRVAKPVRAFLHDRGIDVENKRTKQVDTNLLDCANIIVYMDDGNKRRLEEINPKYLEKAVCLAWYLNKKKIPDPAFLSSKSERFQEILKDIVKATQRLAMDLVKGNNESRSNSANS